MGKALYWLSDAEWARLEPLMPRGRKGRTGSMTGG
jgi:transposase